MEVLTFGCPQALSLHARISRQRLMKTYHHAMRWHVASLHL